MIYISEHYYAKILEKSFIDYPAPDVDTTQDVLEKEENVILCKDCMTTITSQKYAISIHGSHIHHFTNPAAILYTIRCFSSAHGCITGGELSSEFTWFEDFLWCYALCSACMSHLGWFYVNENKNFYGLIADRLFEIR